MAYSTEHYLTQKPYLTDKNDNCAYYARCDSTQGCYGSSAAFFDIGEKVRLKGLIPDKVYQICGLEIIELSTPWVFYWNYKIKDEKGNAFWKEESALQKYGHGPEKLEEVFHKTRELPEEPSSTYNRGDWVKLVENDKNPISWKAYEILEVMYDDKLGFRYSLLDLASSRTTEVVRAQEDRLIPILDWNIL